MKRTFTLAILFISFTVVLAQNSINCKALIKDIKDNVGIVTHTPQKDLHINDIFRIGTETIEDTVSNRLSFIADLLLDNDNTMQLGTLAFRWQSLWARGGIINTSDRRSKTNIATLNYGLKEIIQLQPVSFNWKTNTNDDAKLGLIAQDLSEIIQEVVKTHDWETNESGNKMKIELERKGSYYTGLAPALIRAIQEQQEIIDNQDFKIERLFTEHIELKLLKSRIRDIEALLKRTNVNLSLV